MSEEGNTYAAEKIAGLAAGRDIPDPEVADIPVPDVFTTADEYAASKHLELLHGETQTSETPSQGQPFQAPITTQGQPDPNDGIRTELEEVKAQNSRIFFQLRKGQEEAALRAASASREPLPPEPDKNEDPQRYIAWHEEKGARATEDAETQQNYVRAKAQQIDQTIQHSEAAIRVTNPDYDNALRTGHQQRVQYYLGMGYDPQNAAVTVQNEIKGEIIRVVESGGDPAKHLYGLATQALSQAGIDWRQAQPTPNGQPTPQPAPITQQPQARTPPLPSLSQLNGGATTHTPPRGMSTITSEQFYQQIPFDTRIAVEIEHPRFMQQLRAKGHAQLPEGLVPMFRG